MSRSALLETSKLKATADITHGAVHNSAGTLGFDLRWVVKRQATAPRTHTTRPTTPGPTPQTHPPRVAQPGLSEIRVAGGLWWSQAKWQLGSYLNLVTCHPSGESHYGGEYRQTDKHLKCP